MSGRSSASAGPGGCYHQSDFDVKCDSILCRVSVLKVRSMREVDIVIAADCLQCALSRVPHNRIHKGKAAAALLLLLENMTINNNNGH